jgi:hypothetical protein
MKSERRKQRERTAVADLVIGVLAPVIAPIIARVLAMFPVDKAKEFLEDHLKLGDLHIPIEHLKENPIFRVLTEAAGGSAAGYTVATIAETIWPNLSEENVDYLQDLALVVTEQYAELKRAKGETATTATTTSGSSPQKERGEERVTPMATYRNWLVSSSNPTICVCETCGVSHHTEIKNVSVGGGGRSGAPPRMEPKRVPKPEFNLVPFEDIMATPGIHAPANAAEGYVAGCNCARAFQADKSAYEVAQAKEAAANAPKPEPAVKPGKPTPRSFADLLGEALTQTTDAVLRTNAERLRDLLAADPLNDEQYAQLEYCDSMGELRALAACTTKKQLLAILPTLEARDDRGFLGDGVREARSLLRHAGKHVREIQEAGKEAQKEFRGQRDVIALCGRMGVRREEVLAVTPTCLRKDQLTVANVVAATRVDPATQLTPIAAWRQQNQQTQQPAGAAQGGRPGLGRRLWNKLWH